MSRKELIAECKRLKGAGLLDASVRCNGTSVYLAEQIKVGQRKEGGASDRPAVTRHRVPRNDADAADDAGYTILRVDVPNLDWYDNVDYLQLNISVERLVTLLDKYDSDFGINVADDESADDIARRISTLIHTIIDYGAPGAQVLGHYLIRFSHWDRRWPKLSTILQDSLLSQIEKGHSPLRFLTDGLEIVVSDDGDSANAVAEVYLTAVQSRLFPLAAAIRENGVELYSSTRVILADMIIEAHLSRPIDRVMIKELNGTATMDELKVAIRERWMTTMDKLFEVYSNKIFELYPTPVDGDCENDCHHDPYSLVTTVDSLLAADEQLGTNLLTTGANVGMLSGYTLPAWLLPISRCLSLLTTAPEVPSRASLYVGVDPLLYIRAGMISVIHTILSHIIAVGPSGLRDRIIRMIKVRASNTNNALATMTLQSLADSLRQ